MTTTDAAGAVVVGYDASPHSDTALAWAVRYATDHGRHLLIVHAAGVPTVYASFAGPVENRRELRIAGRRTTDLALGQVRSQAPELDARVHLAMGTARDVLLDSLAGAHLLVVGSRGRGSLAAFLLGSVSAGVAGHATCPVVVVRAAERRDPHSTFAGHVVVGIDGTASSEAVLEAAFALASAQSQPLAVLHSWVGVVTHRDLTDYEVRLETNDENELLVAESLAGFSEKYPDVLVHVRQEEGDPGRALVDASRDAEVVVVGSRGRGDAKAVFLGSVSRHVVEHAHAPVMVVRTAVEQVPA